jgi:hypothetical protein
VREEPASRAPQRIRKRDGIAGPGPRPSLSGDQQPYRPPKRTGSPAAGDVDEASPPILSSTARLLVLARIDVALVRTERADRPRSDFCIAMAEQVAEEVDPACLVLVRGEHRRAWCSYGASVSSLNPATLAAYTKEERAAARQMTAGAPELHEIRAVGAKLLPSHGCRSGTGSDRALVDTRARLLR